MPEASVDLGESRIDFLIERVKTPIDPVEAIALRALLQGGQRERWARGEIRTQLDRGFERTLHQA